MVLILYQGIQCFIEKLRKWRSGSCCYHFIYLPSVLAIVDLMICSSCFVMEMAGMRCSGTVLGKGERGVGGATDLADGEWVAGSGANLRELGWGGKKEASSRPCSAGAETGFRSWWISVAPPQTPSSGGSPARLRAAVVKEMASEIKRRRRRSDFVDGEIVCRLIDFVEGDIKGKRKLSATWFQGKRIFAVPGFQCAKGFTAAGMWIRCVHTWAQFSLIWHIVLEVKLLIFTLY